MDVQDASAPHPECADNVPPGTNTGNDIGDALLKVELLLESLVDALQANKSLSIPLRSRLQRARPAAAGSNHAAVPARRNTARSSGSVSFPGRTVAEAKKFARLVKILQLSHGALISGTLLTRRNVYYQDQDLFESQRNVDELVDDLSYTLGLPRDALKIVAAAKGIMSGLLRIELQDSSIVGFSAGSSGGLVPCSHDIKQIDLGGSEWILVIEKEATFRTLSASHFWQSRNGKPGILITGKGYPDYSTLSFLRLAQTTCPTLRIYCVVDFDPHGLNILRCYLTGPSAIVQDGLGLPGLVWLGVKSEDIMNHHGASSLPVDETCSLFHDSQGSQETVLSQPTSISSIHCREPITFLTERDRNLAKTLLERYGDEEAGQLTLTFDEIKRELQIMLMMNVKAEIQWIDDGGDISAWIKAKLSGIEQGFSRVT